MLKQIIIILLAAIAGIAYLNNAPALNGTAQATIEVPMLDIDNSNSDDILAAAFDSSDNNDHRLEDNVEEITIASTRISTKPSSTNALPSNSRISHAYKSKKSDLQVKGYGTVLKILADDLKGSRHQRFILSISHQHTILVAHNIDLAPRINNLKQGDIVQFNGEYEWNEKGGVVHWTHYDPNNQHVDGWLKHEGNFYQKKSAKKTFKSAKVSTSSTFKCDGRQHCSQMGSYEEAKFFLQNCPNTKMDGDRDGIPCERQF